MILVLRVGSFKIHGDDMARLSGRMEYLKSTKSSDVLAYAVILGDEKVIKEYLDEYPNEVRLQRNTPFVNSL